MYTNSLRSLTVPALAHVHLASPHSLTTAAPQRLAARPARGRPSQISWPHPRPSSPPPSHPARRRARWAGTERRASICWSCSSLRSPLTQCKRNRQGSAAARRSGICAASGHHRACARRCACHLTRAPAAASSRAALDWRLRPTATVRTRAAHLLTYSPLDRAAPEPPPPPPL